MVKLLAWFWSIVEALFPPPAYDQDPKTLDMNQPEPVILTKREELLKIFKEALGTDASPLNKAPSDFACAEAMCALIQKVFPDFPTTLSTVELYYFLKESPHFVQTTWPKAGNVVVSPRRVQYGHAGGFIENNLIASNDSKTGRFELNYSIDEWAKEMRDQRGLRIFFFEAI